MEYCGSSPLPPKAGKASGKGTLKQLETHPTPS